jgi:hypothetical protein
MTSLATPETEQGSCFILSANCSHVHLRKSNNIVVSAQRVKEHHSALNRTSYTNFIATWESSEFRFSKATMTTTRSAAKKQEQSGAPPADEAQPGSKHKTQEAPASRSPKRTKKTDRTAAR